MRKSKLIENVGVMIPQVSNIDIITANLCSEYGDCSWCELAVELVYLRYLAFLHQTHHWQTCGNDAYSDHLLFQRLYEGVTEEIDSIAEKALGVGSPQLVSPLIQVKQLSKLVNAFESMNFEFVRKSLMAELSFLQASSVLAARLTANGLMTRGIDNLLAGIDDLHENHVYLLNQRLRSGQI